MTLGDIIEAARVRLAAAAVETPEIDARILVGDALGLTPLDLATKRGRPVDATERDAVEALVARRAAGEPVDRILGWREFWSRRFRLSPATLSPRPDTETLVEAVMTQLTDRARPYRILDLGTGSGALLVAILTEFPRATGLGIDIAPEAVATAQANADANGVGERAAFEVGNWADGLAGPFDLIVSNPPYIASAVIPTLAIEVRAHDPRLALDGGPDGLDAYRAVAAAASRTLVPGGLLVLELGAGQEDDVAAIARAAGLNVRAPALRDLAGIPRAFSAYAQ